MSKENKGEEKKIFNFSDDERRQWFLDFTKTWCVSSSIQTMTFSSNAIRTCLLLNGMACVAILAFLGNLSGKSQGVNHLHICSLICFAIGCLVVVPCLFLSYRAQGNFTHVPEKIMAELPHEDDEKKGRIFNNIAIAFGGLSLLGFVAGTVVFAVALWS